MDRSAPPRGHGYVLAVTLLAAGFMLGYVIGDVITAATPSLEPFVRQKTVLLTTYRRDGTPVATSVSIAVDGGRAFVRTYDRAWKSKRLHHNPEVVVAPSTTRGKRTGPAIRAHARLLNGAESQHAANALAHKYPFLQGVAVPLFHRLAGYRTLHYELTVLDPTVCTA